MTDWNEIANQAAGATDALLAKQISALSRLNDDELQKAIQQSGISQKEMQQILSVVNNAAMNNEEKAAAIKNIGNGAKIIAEIAKLLI